MTTYGVGGRAALFAEVEGPGDLEAVRTACRRVGAAGAGTGDPIAVFVIGRGSNLLVADGGFEGLVLRLGSGFAGLALPDPASVERQHCRRRSSIHRASRCRPVPARAGPPGGRRRVVGALVGRRRARIGGRRRPHERRRTRLGHGGVPRPVPLGRPAGRGRWHRRRRPSRLRLPALDASARPRSSSRRTSRSRPGSADEERASVTDIVKWRRDHQPGGSNAGSVFTNPEGDSAGRLIEAAGLKGFRLGTAQVSEKHANFIQADKGGRADDVRALMEHVRAVVKERSGIELVAEVRLLGFDAGKTGPVGRTEDGDR